MITSGEDLSSQQISYHSTRPPPAVTTYFGLITE